MTRHKYAKTASRITNIPTVTITIVAVGCAFFDELSADNEFCTFSVGFCEIIWLLVGDAVGFMLVGGCETGTRVGVGNEEVGNEEVGNEEVGNDVFIVG